MLEKSRFALMSAIRLVTATIVWPAILTIINFIFREKVTLALPLCSFHARRVRRLRITGVVLLLGCIPIGGLVGNVAPDAAWGACTAAATLLGGLFILHLHTPLWATFIDSEQQAVLRGAGIEFLEK